MTHEERLERRLGRLLDMLGIDVEECPGEDCANGIDVSSYEDGFPCEVCEGTGEILVQRPET